MLVPSVFGRDVFDEFGDFPFGHTGSYHPSNLMKTDVKEADGKYEMVIDLPGINKENVKAELNDGYLTISAETNYSNEDKDKKGRYIRRERHYGSCSRSFYVGDDIKQDEIKACFENGTLKLTIPKKDSKQLPDSKNYIQID